MKVTMYQSTDGELHTTKEACDKRNAMLTAFPAIKESIYSNHSLEGDNDSLRVTEVCEWAYKHAGKLVEILTPFVPPKPRVPRKPKAASGEQVSAPAVIAKAMGVPAAA